MAAQGDKVVLSCAIITLASTVAASVLPVNNGGKGNLPTPRLLIGTAITFIGLSMISDFAPQISTPLALLITSGAAGFYGVPIADNYFNGAHNPVGPPKTKGRAE